jgi:perosamine synthetase
MGMAVGLNPKKIASVDLSDFTRLDPIPPEGIARAVSIMQSGEIFRYCGSAETSEVALLEKEFAKYVGSSYALAVSSCSKAIQLALAASDVGPGSKVLVPGFTFSAVPSAVVLLGAEPVFVECTKDYRIDLEDLNAKIAPDIGVLLLSHMRGHIANMDEVIAMCTQNDVILVEDAAHALGCTWRGRQIGTFGKIGCFSFQSNKIVNAGEGGVLITDDERIMAKAICMSGAYEANYEKHDLPRSAFQEVRDRVPLDNVRMTNVTAAMARPQIGLVDSKAVRYREMYRYVKKGLEHISSIEFPLDHPEELRIPDSLQFRLKGIEKSKLHKFVGDVRAMGIPLTGFFEKGNARAFGNWQYINRPYLPRTEAAISGSCDMRLSSILTDAHLDYLISAIGAAAMGIC